MSNFKISAKDGQARAGVLQTGHGQVQTPVFMPVGTAATVKALDPIDLKSAGAQIILGNTYHLNLRPSSEHIKQLGGLHKFMNWDGPILTDSGGFQAFSLGAMIEHGVRKSGPTKPTEKTTDDRKVFSKITEEGVEFSSHLDGSKHFLSPERSIEIQLNLGSDVILVLDELLSPLANPEYTFKSLERTHRWELASKDYFQNNLAASINPHSQLFGILQGVYDQEIRVKEAKWVASHDFSGLSIGGSFGTSEYWPTDRSLLGKSSDGENTDWAASKAIYQTMEWVMPYLPDEWPKHALGIGEVEDFFNCVERGIDMFDCVAPTRRARNGSLYISPKSGGNPGNKYTLSIRNSEFTLDSQPIDQQCTCYTCQTFSRAYLRHLFMASEILYHRLATIHNVHFMLNLVNQIRESIINQQFQSFKKQWLG